MVPQPPREDEELERIEAQLEAEQQELERAALEQGDESLPEPPAAGEDPPLPEQPPRLELDIPPPSDEDRGEVAGDQDGDAGELSDDEVALLFGPEQLDPFSPEIEQDPDYDPSTAKPAAFR